MESLVINYFLFNVCRGELRQTPAEGSSQRTLLSQFRLSSSPVVATSIPQLQVWLRRRGCPDYRACQGISITSVWLFRIYPGKIFRVGVKNTSLAAVPRENCEKKSRRQVRRKNVRLCASPASRVVTQCTVLFIAGNLRLAWFWQYRAY